MNENRTSPDDSLPGHIPDTAAGSPKTRLLEYLVGGAGDPAARKILLHNVVCFLTIVVFFVMVAFSKWIGPEAHKIVLPFAGMAFGSVFGRAQV